MFLRLKPLINIGKTFVLCLMMVSMMKTTILSTFYQYDKASFIEMFCVNKNRPQLNCDGKCYLAKMQKEQNEKRASDFLKHLQLEVIYFSSANPFTFPNNNLSFPTVKANLPFDYSRTYSFLYSAKLAKPPQPAA